MRQRLTNSKSYSISAEALAALQAGDIRRLIDSHRVRFEGWRMENDDDADDVDDPDTGDDNGGDDDSSGGDSGGDAKSRLKELHQENARRRNSEKELRRQVEELSGKLKQFEDADKSELDKATGSLAEATAKVEKLTADNQQLRITNAFLMDNTYKWRNPRAALRLVDLENVEIDESGKVTGLSEALKALAESDPYLLAENNEDDDNDADESRVGHPPAGRRKKGDASREKLLAQYPQLVR